ncbi:MAG: REP element-mobilizing transposase RayT [Rickettsiales bacterium]|jgi:REP element-mobilizing transposase RayT
MKYDPKVHRRRSIRLKNYDYSQSGAYFITICCKDKKCLFGKIIDGKMILNKFGNVAYDEWIRTAELRKNIVLDEFVIMPNHIHGIIIIRTPAITNNESFAVQTNNESVGANCIRPNVTTKNNINVTKNGKCNHPQKGTSQTIGAIIRGYKSTITKRINFSKSIWQKNYYEHIIRNENSYQSITNYISTNPENWAKDTLYIQ